MDGTRYCPRRSVRSARLGTRACALFALLAVVVATAPRAAAADSATDAAQLVDKSLMTLNAFMADKDMGPPVRSLIQRARGVLIYPQVLRGAFVFGVSGGSGTLLARDAAAGTWGGPAFYTIGEASFGLQAGGDSSQVILIALTDRGVSALLATSAKLGGNMSVALGPVGAGAAAATQNLSADIVSYSLAKGIYAGVSLEGAVVAPRSSLNSAYYGGEVTTTDILIRRTVSNPHSAELVAAVSKISEQ